MSDVAGFDAVHLGRTDPAAAGSGRIGGVTPWLVLLHDLALSAAVMAATLLVRYHFERKPFPHGLLTRACLLFTAICVVLFSYVLKLPIPVAPWWR